MWNLERLSNALPRDFFKELKRCYQPRKMSEEETFVFSRQLGNNSLLNSTSPLLLGNGDRVITGKDVQQVLANSLEATFCPDDEGVTLVGDASGQKVVFSSGLKADTIEDERFISFEQLVDLVAELKNKHSSEPDGIPNSVIKMLPEYFRRVLLIIFNNCINLNYLPRIWKLSTVTFLKKDESVKGDIGNYRPISLLCCVSKLLERFFVQRLEREAEEKRLISDNQFGFRKKLGTTHAIGRLLDLVYDCRSQAQAAAAVFVDLRKAFDSVNHLLLFRRLADMGSVQTLLLSSAASWWGVASSRLKE